MSMSVVFCPLHSRSMSSEDSHRHNLFLYIQSKQCPTIFKIWPTASDQKDNQCYCVDIVSAKAFVSRPPSPWRRHYGEVVESSKSGAYQEDIKFPGLCSWRGYWDRGPFSLLLLPGFLRWIASSAMFFPPPGFCPKATQPMNHRMKCLKLYTKINCSLRGGYLRHFVPVTGNWLI